MPKPSRDDPEPPMSAETAEWRKKDDASFVDGWAKLLASSRKPKKISRLPPIVDHASYRAHLAALTKALQAGKLTPSESRTYLALAQAAYESLP